MKGRAAEQEWLARCLGSETAGPPRVALLEGPLGFGKTALLFSVLADTERPVHFLRGDRFADTGSPLDTARPLIELLFDGDLEVIVAEHSFAAISRRCRTYFANAPGTVVIDDAQWIDPSSLRLFITLAPYIRCTVLAYRTGLVPTELLDAAGAAGAQIDHLVLGPLGNGSIAEMAEDLPAHHRHIVVASAAGSPLFARALIGALRQNPSATELNDLLDAGRGSSSSDPLTSVVGADLRALAPGPRLMLTAIAVLGSLRPDHLAALTHSTNVEDELSVLRERGLLHTEGPEPLHPLVRLTAYTRAGGERSQLHRRAADLPDLGSFARAGHLAALGDLATASEVETILAAAERALDTDPQLVDRWLTAIAGAPHPRRELMWARSQVLLGRPEQATAALSGLIDHAELGPEARVLYAHALRMSGQPGEAYEVLTARGAADQPELLLELTATNPQLDRSIPPDARLHALIDGPEPFASAARAFRAIGLLNSGEISAARREFTGVADTLLDSSAEELRDILDALTAAGWCAYMLDDFRCAIDLAERGLRIARRFGRASPRPGLGCVLAYSLIQVGRLDDADAAADEAAESAARFRVPDMVAMARNAQVLSAFWHQDAELMRQRTEVLRTAERPVVPWWRRTVESTLARCSAMTGAPVPHVLITEPADAMAPMRYADAATVAMFTADPDRARRLLEEGRELAARYGVDSQAAFLGALLAGVIVDAMPGYAETLWTEAERTFSGLGMPNHAEFARASLDELRSRRVSTSQAALTAREREIAGYLVEGATNQQIADKLVLSRRTVEEHVSNILRKLGVGSRHQVAAALA